MAQTNDMKKILVEHGYDNMNRIHPTRWNHIVSCSKNNQDYVAVMYTSSQSERDIVESIFLQVKHPNVVPLVECIKDTSDAWIFIMPRYKNLITKHFWGLNDDKTLFSTFCQCILGLKAYMMPVFLMEIYMKATS